MFGLVVTRASWLPRIASVRGTAALRGFASEGVAGGPSATSSSAEMAAAGAAAAAVGGGSFGGIGGIGGAFRTAFSVVLAGATAVIVEDTLNDLVLWNICKSHAMPVIEGHPRLQRSLGEPFKSEAWWNSSVNTRGKGALVSCVFLLDGVKASCDVNVVLARKPGAGGGSKKKGEGGGGGSVLGGLGLYVPNLFYNLAVPGGGFEVVRMEAILPHEREAGLPGRVNLLQEVEPKGGVLEHQGRRKGAAAGAGGGGNINKEEKDKKKRGWFGGWWSSGNNKNKNKKAAEEEGEEVDK